MIKDALKPIILLVEDNPSEAFLFRQTLNPSVLDAELHVAEDGDEALSFLRNRVVASTPGPDLVLLDFNLPRINGVELFGRMRTEGETCAIAFLSGSESPTDHAQMNALGPVAILPKPRSLAEFRALWTRIRDIVVAAPI